jgi:hypothetical protein
MEKKTSNEPINNGLEPTEKHGHSSLSDTRTIAEDTVADMSRPNSGNCSLPTKPLNERWRQPKTVKQFSAQVNAVATKVLNGQIDMDIARAYATLSRVLAQTISVEVTRSRFLKQSPDLGIDAPEMEE